MKLITKSFIILSLILPMLSAFANVQAISMAPWIISSNNGNKIKVDCSGNPGYFECEITYSNAKGKSKTVATDSHMINDTALFWHGSQYAEMRADVSLGGTFTILVNFNNMSTTQIIYNAFGIDIKRQLIAINLFDSGGPNQFPIPTSKILVTGLYDHSKGIYFNEPTDGDENFDNQGNFVITYYLGDSLDNETKSVTFPVNPAQFQAIDPTIFERNMRPSSVIKP